jgi:hypothetical protein
MGGASHPTAISPNLGPLRSPSPQGKGEHSALVSTREMVDTRTVPTSSCRRRPASTGSGLVCTSASGPAGLVIRSLRPSSRKRTNRRDSGQPRLAGTTSSAAHNRYIEEQPREPVPHQTAQDSFILLECKSCAGKSRELSCDAQVARHEKNGSIHDDNR